jgi:uncharacterized protein
MTIQKTAPRLGLLATAVLLVGASAHAQITLATGTPTYTQNFNSLANAPLNTDTPWTDNSTIAGLYAAKSAGAGFPVVAAYRPGNGGSNSGQLYSFGDNTGPSTERAFGSIASGTPGNFNYGFRFVNGDTNDLLSLAINYTGEQWRTGGGVTAAQALTFEYQVFAAGTGSINAAAGWTALGALDFSVLDTGTATVTAGVTTPISTQSLSGTITTTVPSGSEIWVRWTDLNNTGNDHGLALDDLTASATFSSAVPEPGTLALIGLSLLPGIALLRRRK